VLPEERHIEGDIMTEDRRITDESVMPVSWVITGGIRQPGWTNEDQRSSSRSPRQRINPISITASRSGDNPVVSRSRDTMVFFTDILRGRF
jgi:hypothetical protein